MKRPTLRIALGAFVFGVELLRLFGVTLAPAPPLRLTRLKVTPPLQLYAPTFAPGEPSAPDVVLSSPVQEEFVWMNGMGQVRVVAYEPPGEQMHLVFERGRGGGVLFCALFGKREENGGRRLRFRVLREKGLPQPLVVGVAYSPGGAERAWEARAVGVRDGELWELTDEPLRSSGGGFHFGDLGGGRGFGVAAAGYVLDYDPEARDDLGRYDFNFYRWDARRSRFEWSSGFRTERRFPSPRAAARGSGLNYEDIRLSLPGFARGDIY